MRDYADAMGGQCVINSTPGAGTEVAAALPLSPPGAEESLEKGGL
jgi:signal transduction histidine kinase